MIEIDTGEVVLFWDTRPRDTGKLARALRADLAQLEADEFLAKWRQYERRSCDSVAPEFYVRNRGLAAQ